MSTNRIATDRRRHLAAEMLHGLGTHRSDVQRLSVQCARSHHLAFVYDTDVGLVVSAAVGGHAHGSKDFVDTPHHGAARPEYADLLEQDPLGTDDLPAWCDCGPHTLSRTSLLAQIRSGQHTARVP